MLDESVPHKLRLLIEGGASALMATAMMLVSFPISAEPPRAIPCQELLHLLVYGARISAIPADCPAAVRAELEPYLRRFGAYRSTRTDLARNREMGMVHDTYVRYERQLAAISANPQAPALALAYVSELKPCYEWEGYHHCPEREAQFALQYQAAHPNSPFSAYLPLLAAHRWQCAAQGCYYE